MPPNSSFPRAVSIYAVTNTKTGTAYVGSAWHPERRWVLHRNSLRRGDHHCKALQRAWAKHGEPSFTFSVIETLTISSARERFVAECAWIVKERRYNSVITDHTGSAFVLNAATRAAIKETSLKLWQDPDNRTRIIAAMTSAWHDPGRKKRLSQRNKEMHAASEESRNRIGKWIQTDAGAEWIVSRNKAWWSVPENREKMRQKARERCTPEFMAKCVAAGMGRKSPEAAERHRAALKQRMADPEEKARMAEVNRQSMIRRGIANVERAVTEARPLTRSQLRTGLMRLSRLSVEAAAAVTAQARRGS